MSGPGVAGGSRRSSRVWLGVALLMAGLNLRPVVVAVSPLLNSIEAATGLSPAAAARRPGLWREGLAWQVSLFMGLQSLNYYTMYSWLPDFFI